MASDVENHTTFYADLPSIFENNSSSTAEPTLKTHVPDVNNEKSYQPMFSSFLFADADPLNSAAFVPSSNAIETGQGEERPRMDVGDRISPKPISSSRQTTSQSLDEIDEDDFDGIPIRHSSITIKEQLNGESQSLSNHHQLFSEVENTMEDNVLDDELFLNGFNDEETESNTRVPALFKNIPDIDDLNEHIDDDHQVPFDRIDMSDQSESLRSSSPDSLLSSSHSQDDDEDMDHEVAQWNDDLILNTTATSSSNNQVNPPINVRLNPFDQVDFIDTSRSNSRCSNNSFQLSTGYTDQARQFLSDDGELSSPSDSDDDDKDHCDNDNLVINFTGDTSEQEENDDICLQVQLDDHRSDSPFSQSISTRSSSPIPDQTPILDIDEENPPTKSIQIAPIAALDDDDDEDTDENLDHYDHNLPMFISDQPVLPDLRSNLKSFIQFHSNHQQTELARDIIEMRHLLNENNHDDEFLAIMHNPKMFEEVLDDINEKKSDSVERANSAPSTFRPSVQLSNDNRIKRDSFEQHQNRHQTSSVSGTNKDTIDVNHLDDETDVLVDDLPQKKGKPLSSVSMDYSSESDDDLELFQTLSQIHDVINPPAEPSTVLIENAQELLNETEQISRRRIVLNSPDVIDRRKQSHEEQEEKNEKNNVILNKNHNDVGGDATQTERNENQNDEGERDDGEEKKATTIFSLPTSSFPPLSFTGESFSPLDPDTSSSLTNLLLLSSSFNHHNESITFPPNQLTTADLQISNVKQNMSRFSDEQITATTDLFDPFSPTSTTATNLFDEQTFNQTDTNSSQPLANYNFDDLWNQSISHIDSPSTKNNNSSDITWDRFFGEEETLNDYLTWICQHLNESLPEIEFTSTHNLESIVKDIQMSTLPFEPIPSPPLHVDHTVANPLINAIQHQLFPIDELEQPNPSPLRQSMTLYEEDENEIEEEPAAVDSFDEQVQSVVDKLVSQTLETALTEVNNPYQPVEHFVDQVLSEAIYEIHQEEQEVSNEHLPVENLASIISWHDQSKAATNQLPDPFDQKFDSVWSQHFHAPDDTTHENIFQEEEEEEKPIVNDPWLMSPTHESQGNVQAPISFFEKTFDEVDLPSSTMLTQQTNETLAKNNNLMKYSITAPVIDDSGDENSNIEDYFRSKKNDTNEILQEQPLIEQTEINVKSPEDLFPTNPFTASEIESKFDDDFTRTSPIEDNSPWTTLEPSKSSGIGDDEPWELEDHGEEKLTPAPTTTRLPSTTNENDLSPVGKVNLHSHFFAEDSEQVLSKSVRFDDNVQSIEIINPVKESSSSDSEEIEVEDINPSLQTNNDRMEASYVTIDENDFQSERPYETVELSPQIDAKNSSPFNPNQTTTSNENIPTEPSTATQVPLNRRLDSELPPKPASQSTESVLLRSNSKEETAVDGDEVNGIISCTIDNIQVNIDAKSINPFKCVVTSAGTLNEDNQTAVIAIYGCALPDHRLREYRYIMDQLFYYVYHQLNKLVINDYVLIYFHGATSKHRTPDLKFLRKCYQMINFRLRKNLRAVYVVHPTRWLRTVIALSRPFFSRKFYHKIHYLYTIAELERQFPRNRLSIPTAIEQTDWLYSQKYDRDNASINRSFTQSMSRSATNNDEESIV